MISRKTLQSFLSIMLVVFLTAGCGGANGTADNSSSTSTNSPSVIYHSFFNVTNTNFCTCDEIA